MSEHDIDIADMQCWIFRMAQGLRSLYENSRVSDEALQAKTSLHEG